MASNPIDCFQFLVDNVPSWVAILDSLTEKVKRRRTESSSIPVPTRKLKKSGSNESIRPTSKGDRDSDGKNQREDPFSNHHFESSPQGTENTEPSTSTPPHLSYRKRKTRSILSNESLPSKYRSRSMIIVYYDSEIQKSFEQLVRYIGTGRNNIRRARLASRMNALTSGIGTGIMGSRTWYDPFCVLPNTFATIFVTDPNC